MNKTIRIFLAVFITFGMLVVAPVSPARADCTEAPGAPSPDVWTCDNTPNDTDGMDATTNDPVDVITVDSGASVDNPAVGGVAIQMTDGTLTNNGNVSNNEDSGAAVFASGDADITNNGDVDANGISGTGIATLNGDVLNDGTIQADGMSGTAVYTETGGVLNNGTISASGDAGTGIYTGSGDNTVTNNGSISAGGALGVAILTGSGDDTVVIGSGATVNGLIDGGANTDILQFTSLTQAELAGLDPALDSYGGYSWANFEQLIGLLDATAPVVSSSLRADLNPTNAPNVRFTVTFSEPVTGVGASDFALTATGAVSGASVTGISGSGTTHTVTVNRGSGNGTLRLDVADDDSIMDAASNPLGGIGLNNGDFTSGQAYLIGSQTFADVPPSYWAWQWAERLYSAGITSGCGSAPLIYCPEADVTRAQMAVFLLRGIHGASYTPPPATGTVFDDVPASYWAAAWIEQLFAEGITEGCTADSYCPNQIFTTRAQMAVFLLRGKYGAAYTPPAPSGIFNDVPTTYWAAAWIEQLYVEGITGGCGSGNYCPDSSLTRAQMAVFLVRTFNLP